MPEEEHRTVGVFTLDHVDVLDDIVRVVCELTDVHPHPFTPAVPNCQRTAHSELYNNILNVNTIYEQKPRT